MMKKSYLLDTNICVFCMRGKFAIGRKIENFDMAIGSIALQQKMVMVTDNVDHFVRIRGIEIEDWKTEEPKV